MKEGEVLSIKEMRTREELSQAALAASSCVSVRLLQEYEQGKRDVNGARLKTLLSISETLDCSLADILTDPGLIEQVRRYEKRITGADT